LVSFVAAVGTCVLNRVGAAFNTFDKTIDEKHVFLGGRYFLGLARSFYAFPTTQQTIEFSQDQTADAPPIVANIQDGSVTFDVSFQYQLDLTRLVNIYKDFELNYHERFIRFAQAALQNAAAQVTDFKLFYTDRVFVQESVLLPSLRAALETQHCKVHGIQLRRVVLPTKTEDEIVAKLVRLQQEETARRQQQQGTIVSQTDVLVADVQREIAIYQSNRTAQARILTETAEATALSLGLNQQSASFNALKNGVGLSASQIVRYRFLNDLKDATSTARFLVGFDNNVIVSL
jgi:hypothetical protein